MTLRVRLTIAFTAILLAPTLLAGAFVYRGVFSNQSSAVTAAMSDQATTAVRGLLAAECARLSVAARALAVQAQVRHQTYAVTPAGTSGVWALCGSPATPGTGYTHLAARAPVVGGWAYAVRPVDAAFLARLSTAAGMPVSLGGQAPGTSADPLPLRFGPPPGGTAPAPPDRRLALVLATALTAVTTAAALAAWLSALVTRPLRQLLVTVDRAASGDLTVRSQLTGRDEVGRIGTRLDGLVGGAREVQRLAVTDELTGLGNVRHLADSLRLEVERAARFRRTLGVLLLDLDHFKEVNDAHGHRAGDAVLTEFADRIKGVVREVDLAFRQGGEEFVILLPETDIAGSLTAARRIGEAVRAEPFTVGAVQIAVTVSIGVAVYPRHAGSGGETLEAADAALYAAKAAGRDTFSVAGGVLPAQRESRYVLPVAAGPADGASVGTPRTQIPADG